MKCSGFDPMIEPYLDGELSSDDARAIESHVAECEACAEELKLARQVSEGLSELTPLDCPDVVTARVRHTMSALRGRMDSVSEENWARRKTWNKTIWQIAAVVALVAAGVVLAVSQSRILQPIDSPNLPDGYTLEEVTQAKRQVEWTLAYVDHVARHSMQRVGQEVIRKHISHPLRSAVSTLLVLDGREAEALQ
jgi:anti-sigma factor RsiW